MQGQSHSARRETDPVDGRESSQAPEKRVKISVSAGSTVLCQIRHANPPDKPANHHTGSPGGRGQGGCDRRTGNPRRTKPRSRNAGMSSPRYLVYYFVFHCFCAYYDAAPPRRIHLPRKSLPWGQSGSDDGASLSSANLRYVIGAGLVALHSQGVASEPHRGINAYGSLCVVSTSASHGKASGTERQGGGSK